MSEIEIKFPKGRPNPFSGGIEVLLTEIAGKSLIARTMDRLHYLGFVTVYIDIDRPPIELVKILEGGVPWGMEIKYDRMEADLHPVVSPAWTHPSEELEDTRKILSDGGREFDLLPSWNETPGVWMNRGATVDPTARIIPPCFIGENVHVGKRTVIGPYACIERDVFIGKEVVIENSHVHPETLLHSGLHLEDVIVNKNRLYDLKNNCSLHVDPDLMEGIGDRKTTMQGSETKSQVTS